MFEVSIEGAAELQQMLARIRAAGLNTEKPRKLAGEEMLLRSHLRFVAGVAPDGSAWPASARALGFGGKTLHQTGKLEGSIHYELDGEDLLLVSDDKRARIHQEGGTIEPKNARALAIPMSEAVANAYRAGVSIRDQYPDAFVLRSEAGNLFLVRRAGDATGEGSMLSQIEFLFMLVHSVEMPARPFIGFSEDDLNMVEGVFIRHFSAAEMGGGL